MSDVSDYSHLPDFRSDETKELHRLHSEIARLRREKDELSQGIAELERRIDASYAASEIGDLRARVAELQSGLQASCDDFNRLRREKEALVEAMTIIADWDKAPITGEWRESLLGIIRSICDCARAALRSATETKGEPS